MIDEEKRKIVFWDDAGYLMHSPDTIEKIKKDAEMLIETYLKSLIAIESDFTSIRNSFRKLYLETAFTISLLALVVRAERLNK